jgi:hypothetical protein
MLSLTRRRHLTINAIYQTLGIITSPVSGKYAYIELALMLVNKTIPRGHAVAYLVEALSYKPEGRGFKSR